MKILGLIWIFSAALLWAQRADLGSNELERYFAKRVSALEGQMADIHTAAEWKEQAPALRKQLREMLGLDPMPERTPLRATVTGTIEREDFTVEKLHFQSSPGLYVTANFYLPKKRAGKVPTILYVCGHGPSKMDGVSFGNKVTYQHHGIWFARNGYACLVIDTIHLGEIEAIHHGTYRYGRWWWHARGYTPAGVEAWNCVRALDYLESRPEVDAKRFGVTGRSGGGAYSWWIAAIDERIVAAVPVAGIASLRNHVVDGCVEGHCDCMYHFNTYRWDFEQVAALVAPRALLISNTDKDSIFPLDGVYQVYRPVRRLYDLHQAAGKLGLNIEEGPHKDTQPLRTSAFHWMNRHLKGTDRGDTFEMAAVKLFEPEELKVFEQLPGDEINTTIDEVFVPKAPEPDLPDDAEAWKHQMDRWGVALREFSFRGWPKHETMSRLFADHDQHSAKGVRIRRVSFHPEPEASCYLALVRQEGANLRALSAVELRVVDDEGWKRAKLEGDQPKDAWQGIAYLCPRGTGAVKWSGPPAKDPKKQVQIMRRYAMIGQTLDGMRVWDIRQAIRLLRKLCPEDVSITLRAEGTMAGHALYASLLLDRPVDGMTLRNLPGSHQLENGPIYLNVLKFMDMPQAVAMAASRSAVTLQGDTADWEFPLKIATKFDWPAEQLVIKDADSTKED